MQPPARTGLLVKAAILMAGLPLATGALVAVLLLQVSPSAAVSWSLVAAGVAFLAGTAASLYIALGRAVELLDDIEIETRSAGARARASAEEKRQRAATRSPADRDRKGEGARDRSEAQ